MSEKRIVRILFLGGAKRVSMGQKFLEAGRRLGLEVELFSYELSPLVPVASIATTIEGRRWKDPDIYPHLNQVVIDYGIDILIPFVDGAVEVAARYRDDYGDIWVPVGTPESASAMFDKSLADTLFREHALPVPERWNGCFPAPLPLIAKPVFGSASKGIKVLQTVAELRELTEAGNADGYLIQEYIADRKEITIDCYRSLNGEVICTVPRYRIETQGGEASVTRTFANPEVEKLAVRTLEALDLRGAVTIQLLERTEPDAVRERLTDSRERLTDNSAPERFMLMEINPRLGGGAVCSVHAGAPLPEFILRDYLGMPLEPCRDWVPGTLITRYFSEVCFKPNNNLPC